MAAMAIDLETMTAVKNTFSRTCRSYIAYTEYLDEQKLDGVDQAQYRTFSHEQHFKVHQQHAAYDGLDHEPTEA